MSRSRSNPLSFILLSLFISSTFFSFSHGTSHLHILRHSPIPVFAHERKFSEMVESDTKRDMGETSNKSTNLILAAKRTHRRDPLDGFKFYTGGWNLTNPHYLYSTAFSAAPLFLISVIWLVVFGLCLCCICLRSCCCFCCRREPYGYSRTAYALSLIFLILVTVAAIAGSVFLYTGEEKFQTSTVNVLSYVLSEADKVVQNLRAVFNYLFAAKKIGVGQISLPPELQTNIDGMKRDINDIADNIHNITGKNSKDIQHFLNPMRTALIYVTATMLLLALLGFLFSILGLQCLVFLLLVIGWVAVAGTFTLSGLFLLVHNAVADTCVAMDEWLQNPTANSALENIIPRANDRFAEAILKGTKKVTFSLVNVTNTAITNVYNVDIPQNDGPLYFNRSGPLVPLLCNPFNSNLTRRQCAAGEVGFNNATEVWRHHVCQVSASGNCTTTGRITPKDFTELTASLNTSYGLYRSGPFLVDLVDSTYVKEAFSDISEKYCPGMRKSTKWTYVGFTLLSAAVLLSLILWIVYARERRYRKYTKRING